MRSQITRCNLLQEKRICKNPLVLPVQGVRRLDSRISAESWRTIAGPARGGPRLDVYPGDDRLSHAVARAVPWALEGFTTVFGMGTGVAPPVWPPENFLRTVEEARVKSR